MDLDLYLNDEHVASTQERSRGQKVVITYTDDVAARFGGETSLLSCSLPTPGPSTPSNARAFLEGLLTEGRALEAMAARLRAVQLTDGAPSTPRDAVGLLAAFGRECAGAVIAVDRGSSLSPDGGGYEALDEASVGALISGLPRAPLGINPEAGVRMSLAGAQPKLLLARFDGAWYEPYNGAASTHILKPTQRWPLSADNEAIVMALARAIGLCEHDTWVETIEDVRVFVTARYDRHISPGTRTVTRRHQEDMCQALGVRPLDKYTLGRPSTNIAPAVRSFTMNPWAQLVELFRQIAFRAIVGDEDSHGKNFGLLLDNGRVTLSPLYDSLCTLLYPELDGVMGAPIGRQQNLAKVDMGALLEEAIAMGIPQEDALAAIDALTAELDIALDGLDPDMAAEEAMTAVTQTVRDRLERLRNGDAMGRGTTVPARHRTLDEATWTPRS